MSRWLQHLSKERARRWAAAQRDYDFGEIVAVLIALIGLVPFVTAGLWSTP
jgi:hypothetical protein